MNLSQVILGPVVTEKTVKLAENDQHAVVVHSDATKTEIKSAIFKFYGLEPQSVNIIKTPEKMRVRGRRGAQVKRKTRKKAILTFTKGTTFDLLKLSDSGADKKAVVKKKSEEKEEK